MRARKSRVLVQCVSRVVVLHLPFLFLNADAGATWVLIAVARAYVRYRIVQCVTESARTCACTSDGRLAPHGCATRYVSKLALLRLGPFTTVIVRSPRLMAPSVDGIRPCNACAEHVAVLRSLAGRLRG